MPYAILQQDLDAPPPGGLEKALKNLQLFTSLDAITLARDAFGILIKDLSLADAQLLHHALKQEGIQNLMVDQQELPPLAPAQKLIKADVTDEALLVYDALQRPRRIEWPQVAMIAAGCVRITQFKRMEKTVVVNRGTPDGQSIPIERTEVDYREENRPKCVVEIFAAATPPRYHIDAENFSFACLGDRRQRGVIPNYMTFVQGMLRHAPHAVMNRGALRFKQEPCLFFEYPSKHAFEEEIIWQLWQARQRRTLSAGAPSSATLPQTSAPS
ncbi:MAG: hypothetical protein PHV34_21795 [Verrucomicrobiae bacterium]|nr:hypothetical protein [Verrucomicrobiae bacterium]